MEMTSTRTVIVDGKARDYPLGTPYQAIAADAQDRYPSDILLVDRDGKLCELNKPLGLHPAHDHRGRPAGTPDL